MTLFYRKTFGQVLLLFFAFIANNHVYAQQQKSFFYFKDKTSTTYSADRPLEFISQRSLQRRSKQSIAVTEKDFPPNQNYLQAIAAAGGKIIATSRWLNAALVQGDSAIINKISKLYFVGGAEENFRVGEVHHLNASANTSQQWAFPQSFYGSSYGQISMIGLDKMHGDGFTGKGMLVAILDDGFIKTNTLHVFDSLMLRNQVTSTWDFVQRNSNVYDYDPHGTSVLSCLAAYLPGTLVGGAYDASYLLLRTEDNNSESVVEEIYWLLGAEYADSAGADVLSSSLGYTTFDNAAANHTYSQMDGKTTIVSRAASGASKVGMVVVNSAGNDGDDPWKYIFTPADADSILTAGAVDSDRNYAYFSSKGPTADGRIKPDVAAQGAQVYVAFTDGTVQQDNGTSFSCPLIACLATGLWQGNPALTSAEVIDYIKRSASQYNAPDNLLGYGIPDYGILKALLATQDKQVLPAMDVQLIGNPLEPVLLFRANSSFGEADLILTDVLGRPVFTSKLTITDNQMTIPLAEDLQSGIYFLMVRSGNLAATAKILKQ